MKLVKITSPREGFIYKVMENIEGFFKVDQLLIRTKSGYLFEHYSTVDDSVEFDKSKLKLIGKIGINFKYDKNGKLIEIPREDIEVDDVFSDEDRRDFVISKFSNDRKNHSIIWSCGNIQNETGLRLDYIENNCKKLGIYGINYEFTNSKDN